MLFPALPLPSGQYQTISQYLVLVQVPADKGIFSYACGQFPKEDYRRWTVLRLCLDKLASALSPLHMQTTFE